MTFELTVSNNDLTAPQYIEVELDVVRSSGRVEIAIKDFPSVTQEGYEGMQQEKRQIDYLVRRLRDGGLPIDNDSIIWTSQFKLSAANALKRCGADWLVIERRNGINSYEWGCGPKPQSGTNLAFRSDLLSA